MTVAEGTVRPSPGGPAAGRGWSATAGVHAASSGWLAVAWCVGLAVLGYFWSTAIFNRDPK